MFALNIPSTFGDTIDCRINGKPKRLTWRDEHTLVIEADPYAGRKNIQDSFTSSGRLSSWLGCPTHEMQRPKICARAGSATRLNAGSHPTGRRALTATGNETAEVRLSCNRSPLFARLTEMACCAALAAPGALRTAGNAPATRPTAIATATTVLHFPSISASQSHTRLGLAGQAAPLYVSQFQQ